MKKIKSLILLLALVLLTSCGANQQPAPEPATGPSEPKTETTEKSETTAPTTENKTVKVGVVNNSKAWEYVKEEAAKEGIDIEIVQFDSYTLPNAALDSGEIDLNSFQHIAYLNKESEQLGYDLTPIGTTFIAPIGLYSEKIKSIEELKDGDTIVIPDDITNGGRALILLEKAGLITVNDEAGLTPTLKDIENPRNFNIIELEAANTPSSLQEAELVSINSGFAVDNGLKPNEDAVYLEDASDLSGDNPYVNVIVARTEDKDNETFKRIVEIFQSDRVKEINQEETKGATYPVW